MNLILFFLFPFFSNSFSSFLSPAKVEIIKNKIVELIDATIANTQCGNDLKMTVLEAFELKLWALKILDANAKLYPGSLNGYVHQPGNFDECLSVNEQVNGSIIQGQYCTVFVSLKGQPIPMQMPQVPFNISNHRLFIIGLEIPVSIFHGICVPKSCSKNELSTLWDYVEEKYDLPLHTTFSDFCDYPSKPVPVNNMDVFAYLFFALVVLIVVASTSYDLYTRLFYKNSKWFAIFSAYTNTVDLFTTQEKTSNLSCLCGIKVLCAIWVILGHLMALMIVISNNVLYFVTEWKFQRRNVFFLAGFFAVDTFFTLSGFLVAYVCLRSGKAVKLSDFYLHRFFRLIPVLFAVILIRVCVLKHFVTGPYASIVNYVIKYHCQYWWNEILFVNNMVKQKYHCIPPTWYLAVDTQLYMLAPLFLFMKTKHFRKAVTGAAIVCAAAMLYNFWFNLKHKTGFVFYEFDEFFFYNVYLSVEYHMPTWLVGIIFGYLLYYHENIKNIKVSKMLNLALWIIALGVMLKLILYHYTFLITKYNEYRSASMNAFARPLWSLAVGFMIFSCATGSGGVANTFLSNSFFRILNRLSYCMFLCHDSVMFFVGGRQMVPITSNNYKLFNHFWVIFILTVALSIVLYLAFEAPFMAVKKYTKHRQGKSEMI